MYPYFYSLHNNYVVTVYSENTVLFDMGKVRKMYNSKLLWFLNPLNHPVHGFKEIEAIPRPNFLLYEAKFDAALFREYAKFKNNGYSISDSTTIQSALDEVIKLTF